MRLAQAAPNLNPKLARDESQKMYGQILWTTIRKSGETIETSTYAVKGSFIRHRNTSACYEMPPDALDERAITFKGFEGTVTAEVNWEDKADYSSNSPEDREDIIIWQRKSTILPVKMSEKDAREGLYFYQYGPTERVTMGCVTLNPTTGRFWLAPPWTNNMDSWVSPAHVNAKTRNANGRELPFKPEAQAGYRFGPPPAFTEGRYDPKSDSYTGSWSKTDPPSPGPDEDYIEYRVNWTLAYKELGDVIVKGPKCACKPKEVLSYMAETRMMGGQFEKFELSSDGIPPSILKNQGGSQPLLELRGDASSTGKTKVVAVYKDSKSQQHKSKPFEINFCELEKPELLPLPIYNRTDDKRAYMHTQADGQLEIEVKTKYWLNGDEDKSQQLEWEISDPNKRLTRTGKDQNRTMIFKAKGLPTSNQDFGRKEIKVKAQPGQCDCLLEPPAETVRVFFPIHVSTEARDGELKNNPGGKEPDWFYYWKQTAAWNGISKYEIRKQIPGLPFGAQPDPREVARYHQFDDVMYFTPKLVQVGAPGRENEDLRTGIDAFATALRHEEHHHQELVSWWGLKMARYPKLDTATGLPFSLLDPTSPDHDLDMVPNQVERENNCDDGFGILATALKTTSPKQAFLANLAAAQASCPSLPSHVGALTDIELNAYEAGWAWPRGAANHEDWSWPGHQCDAKNCDPYS